MDRFATYDFLLTFHFNHGPISYRFRVLLLLFCVPAERVSLGIGYWRWGSKTRMMVLPGWQSSLTISSAVWVECTNVTDRWTDRRTDTASQLRPRLRIASVVR